MCKTHPDAKGLDLRSFLIMPVQRMPRYSMLLQELLSCSLGLEAEEEEHLRDALAIVKEVAMHSNEQKRSADQVDELRGLSSRFAEASLFEKEIVAYDRNLIREGSLVKARLSHRQRRQLFLFNDLLLYAAPSIKGLVIKGRIPLKQGVRLTELPSTADMPHAFAIVDMKGKGYTWLADSASDKSEWFAAIDAALKKKPTAGGPESGKSQKLLLGGGGGGKAFLANVGGKGLSECLAAIRAGAELTKYNKRDGKAAVRFVKVEGDRVRWGCPKTKDTKSEQKLTDASALQHGAKSGAFFKTGSKSHQDWLCFSLVFKSRTLDFAAPDADTLFTWYLALAALVPHSSEPLMDEEQLKERIAGMVG